MAREGAQMDSSPSKKQKEILGNAGLRFSFHLDLRQLSVHCVLCHSWDVFKSCSMIYEDSWGMSQLSRCTSLSQAWNPMKLMWWVKHRLQLKPDSSWMIPGIVKQQRVGIHNLPTSTWFANLSLFRPVIIPGLQVSGLQGNSTGMFCKGLKISRNLTTKTVRHFCWGATLLTLGAAPMQIWVLAQSWKGKINGG